MRSALVFWYAPYSCFNVSTLQIDFNILNKLLENTTQSRDSFTFPPYMLAILETLHFSDKRLVPTSRQYTPMFQGITQATPTFQVISQAAADRICRGFYIFTEWISPKKSPYFSTHHFNVELFWSFSATPFLHFLCNKFHLALLNCHPFCTLHCTATLAFVCSTIHLLKKDQYW